MLDTTGKRAVARDRRGFLKLVTGAGLVAASGLAMNPTRAFADLPPLPGLRPEPPAELSMDVRELAFEAAHTGEKLTVPYFDNGRYVRDALQAVKHIMRDHRNDQEHDIDPALLDVLTVLRERLGTTSPVTIVSAYRSPETNAMLAAQSGGVAKNSYHLRGQAIDIRMDDRTTREIFQVALNMQAGGTSRYGRSDFVHIDTGPVRTW